MHHIFYLRRWIVIRRIKTVKYETLELGNRYISTKDGTIYNSETLEPIKYFIGSHGYFSCYLEDIHGTKHSLLVHRIIACTWIQNTYGLDVHHLNHDRLDPSVKNLEVLTINEHRKMHNTGSNNSTAKLCEMDVHEICKMLEDKVSHKKIAKIISDKLNKNITIDSIDKISNGTNWTEISSQYNIVKESRESMNEFSDRAKLIGEMKVKYGLSNKEIAIQLGIATEGKQFIRFIACALRYAKRYRMMHE